MFITLKEQGIRVPDGFAITAEAYWTFIEANDLHSKITRHLDTLKTDEGALSRVGRAIRRLFLNAHFPDQITKSILNAYAELCEKYDTDLVDVAWKMPPP
jgi:pyruvate, water dikinase